MKLKENLTAIPSTLMNSLKNLKQVDISKAKSLFYFDPASLTSWMKVFVIIVVVVLSVSAFGVYSTIRNREDALKNAPIITLAQIVSPLCSQQGICYYEGNRYQLQPDGTTLVRIDPSGTPRPTPPPITPRPTTSPTPLPTRPPTPTPTRTPLPTPEPTQEETYCPVCGDGVCDPLWESPCNCPADCPGAIYCLTAMPICGNGACENNYNPAESRESCPIDCAPGCTPQSQQQPTPTPQTTRTPSPKPQPTRTLKPSVTPTPTPVTGFKCYVPPNIAALPWSVIFKYDCTCQIQNKYGLGPYYSPMEACASPNSVGWKHESCECMKEICEKEKGFC